MNYLTLALQLLTMYALYRLWTNVRKLNAKPDTAPKQEPLSEGSELANVKLEPKEKSAPPPPAGQLKLEIDETDKPEKVYKARYGRTITSLSDREIAFLLYRLRAYAKEKLKHSQGKAKRPHVSEVFPLVGSNLKALVSPSIMTDEEYENWKRYGTWAASMQHTDGYVIGEIRKMK
jgi:hypothetical protein